MALKKKTQTAPTIEERLAASAAKKAAALSVFEDVVRDLEDAAMEADEVARMAQAEIDRLLEIQTAAEAEKNASFSRAQTMRETFLA